jgi:cytochrome c553
MRAGTTALAGATALALAALGGRALAFQASPAAGAPPAPSAAQVDVTACQACHGANGVSRNQHVPNLAGQQAAYLVLQLQAFKSGTRRNASMEAIAAQLSEAEMNALAAYWNSQPADGAGTGMHAAAAGPAIPSRMAFPANFPTGFTLYQTVNSDGAVAERYANAPALAAARAGRPLPDGSVILVVNRPAAGAPPTSYAGMETRAGWGAAIPALLRDANWDFALFNAQRVRNDGLNQAQCLACHHPQAANSHVFTLAQLRAAATGAGH